MSQGHYNAPPIIIEKPLANGKHNIRLIMLSLLVLLVVEIFVVGGSFFLVYIQKPPANIDVPAGETAYMRLWGPETTSLPDHFTVQDSVDKMRAYALSFLWDTYPKLQEVDEAENLAFKWPPRRGTRYRLAAYPFVQASKDPVPIAVVRAIFQMTNKYADQATPPAWYVSVYDESDWTRQNIFMPQISLTITSTKDSQSTHMSRRCSEIFSPFKWVEVVRTCYPVTPDSYPLCDDGGQWFYHTPGSGTWFNIGNCLVRYNKIDAVIYCMALLGVISSGAEMSKVFPNSMLDDVAQPLLPFKDKATYAKVYATVLDTPGCVLDDYLGKTTWQDFWGVAKTHFVKRLKNNLGERSFFRTIWKLVKNSKSQSDGSLELSGIVPFLAFYSKEGAPLKGYLEFMAVVAGLISLLLAFILTLLACIFGQCSVLLPLIALCLAGGAAWFLWQYGIDAFLSSRGANMLERGLELYSTTVEEVVDFCVEPTVGASDPEKQQFFSGLPSSWIADMGLELFSSMLGFDAVIMHTQPNKSGTYLVEMCDVTKIKLDFGLSPGQPGWWKGGTCGNEDASDEFACDSCPYPDARKDLLKSRGGLCFKKLGVQGFESNYMTMNWTRVGTSGSWPGPAADSTFYTKESVDSSGNLTSDAITNMQDWLKNYKATPCACRESKDALCIGCEGQISDILCNWAKRAALTPTAP